MFGRCAATVVALLSSSVMSAYKWNEDTPLLLQLGEEAINDISEWIAYVDLDARTCVRGWLDEKCRRQFRYIRKFALRQMTLR
jgi:hypothetical protein